MNKLVRYSFLLLPAACLICVVYLMSHHTVGDYGMETDIYRFYTPTARALEQGRIEIDDFHPPLYGWLVGLLTMTGIFPGEFEASLLLSVLGYVGTVLLVWLIARQSFPEKESVPGLAAAIVACNPTLMEHACRSDVHIVYLAISLAGVYYALRKNVWLTGLFVALAIWTRYTWMLSIIPLFFLPYKLKSLPGWGVVAAAWTGLGLLTLAYKDMWFYSLNHVSIAAGLYNIDLLTNVGLWDQLHQAEFEHMNLIQILLYDPVQAAKSIGTHIGVFSYKTLIYLMILPTGLLAIVGMRKKYWGNYRHPLLMWTLMFFAILVMTFWDKQYVLGLIPLLGLAAALCLADLPFPQITRWISLALVAGLTVWGCLAVKDVMVPGPVVVRQIAMAMRSYPGTKIVSRDPRVFYYSGKQPGQMFLTPTKAIRLISDYVFLSSYELTRNDTLYRMITQSDFEKKCDDVTPWPNQWVKVLKLREQYGVPQIINPTNPAP